MQTATTQGIRISVETMYQSAYSKPLQNEYVHAYRVTIENLRSEPVQLLSRQWQIWDSVGIWREVEGEGVVGKQPIIEPNSAYQYVSACPLRSEMGKMTGSFTLQNQEDWAVFEAKIPLFELVAPQKLN